MKFSLCRTLSLNHCVDVALIIFTTAKVDESGIALRVQAALCAFAAKKLPKAKDHADEALRCHNLLFGGGVQFFRQRYRNEFQLKIRSSAVSGKVLDVLWPM